MKRRALSAAVWLTNLPYRLANLVRRRMLQARLARVGAGLQCDTATSTFFTPELIELGDHVFFNRGAYVSGRVIVGNNVLFGPFVTIQTGNHLFGIRGRSVRYLRLTLENPEDIKTTIIEDEVWVGANVIILGGLSVGIGAVIGAGSVVTHDTGPYTVSVGNPCKPIRCIFEDEALAAHLECLGYSRAFAAATVERRRKVLGKLVLPVIDKTDRYAQYYYRGELIQM